MNNYQNKKLKICIFANVDWFVLSHFTHYLEKIVSKNFDVTVITTNTGRCNEIRSIGINVIEIKLNRGYSSLFSDLMSLKEAFFIIKRLSPDVLELITIKPVIFGGLVARILKIKKIVFYMSGLGAIFTNKSMIGRVQSFIVTLLYKFIMKSDSVEVIVENEDDKNIFTSIIKVPHKSIHLINGVGVDLNEFAPKKYSSSGRLRVGLASRLLYDKGILEFIRAAEVCKKNWPEVEFILVGSPDYTNPASLSEADLIDISKKGILKLEGHCNNMPSLMQTLDIFVLPSYREGFPKVIMEASSSGIPVITTDVTGCRSAVLHNQTGYIVPSKNSEALATAIIKLLSSLELRSSFGKNGRKFAESNFDIEVLTLKHMNVWN